MIDKTISHDTSDDKISEGETKLDSFNKKEIRAIFHKNEWFYSVIDIIQALTGGDRASKYWNDLKTQIIDKEGFSQLSDKIKKLRLESQDGRLRPTDVADVETIFRIIQSVPSKKADGFKRWLARVGYERIQEMQNPEIGIKRNIAQYKAQGRSEDWIKSRVKGTLTRNELTDEWKKRGVQEGKEYGHLTNAISQGAFDITTNEHKKLKQLKGQPLRDNMSTLELAIMNLGEAATVEIARTQDAQGFDENLQSAKDGGDVAGKARKDIEERTGKKVVTKQNFLGDRKKIKQ